MHNRLTLRQLVLYISVLAVASSLYTSAVSATTTTDSGIGIDETFYSGNDILWYDPSAQSCSESGGVEVVGDIPSSVSVEKDFTLGTDKSTRPVNLLKQLMADFNLKDYQAAGIVGNFMEESGGKWLPPNINQGSVAGPPTSDYTSGHAYGWAQWDAGRKKAFVVFSVSKGYMKSTKVSATDAANYAYLTHELTETSEGAVLPALKKTSDVDSATFTWQEVFERAGEPHQDVRNTDAREVLNAYQKGTGVSESGTVDVSAETATGGCSTTQATSAVSTVDTANFGEIAFPLRGDKSVVKNASIFHDGTTSQGHPYIAYDIYANAGTQVLAFAKGTVTSLHSSSDLGNGVSIYNKEAGLVVYYTHMANVTVKEGQTISPGDPLGSLASVRTYPAINTDHLHIDASTDKVRQACSRDSCSIESHFRDIGPELYKAFEALPGSVKV